MLTVAIAFLQPWFVMARVNNNNNYYYMAKPVLGKSIISDWFFVSQDFAVWTIPMEMVQAMYFVLEQSWQIPNLQSKQCKKCEYCDSLQWSNKKKLKGLKFYIDFEDEWRRWTFFEQVLLSWRSGNSWCRNWNRQCILLFKPSAI